MVPQLFISEFSVTSVVKCLYGKTNFLQRPGAKTLRDAPPSQGKGPRPGPLHVPRLHREPVRTPPAFRENRKAPGKGRDRGPSFRLPRKRGKRGGFQGYNGPRGNRGRPGIPQFPVRPTRSRSEEHTSEL